MRHKLPRLGSVVTKCRQPNPSFKHEILRCSHVGTNCWFEATGTVRRPDTNVLAPGLQGCPISSLMILLLFVCASGDAFGPRLLALAPGQFYMARPVGLKPFHCHLSVPALSIWSVVLTAQLSDPASHPHFLSSELHAYQQQGQKRLTIRRINLASLCINQCMNDPHAEQPNSGASDEP